MSNWDWPKTSPLKVIYFQQGLKFTSQHVTFVLLVIHSMFSGCTYSCVLALFLWRGHVHQWLPLCSLAVSLPVQEWLLVFLSLVFIHVPYYIQESYGRQTKCIVAAYCCMIRLHYPAQSIVCWTFVDQSSHDCRCTKCRMQWNFVIENFFAYFTSWSELRKLQLSVCCAC